MKSLFVVMMSLFVVSCINKSNLSEAKKAEEKKEEKVPLVVLEEALTPETFVQSRVSIDVFTRLLLSILEKEMKTLVNSTELTDKEKAEITKKVQEKAKALQDIAEDIKRGEDNLLAVAGSHITALSFHTGFEYTPALTRKLTTSLLSKVPLLGRMVQSAAAGGTTFTTGGRMTGGLSLALAMDKKSFRPKGLIVGGSIIGGAHLAIEQPSAATKKTNDFQVTKILTALHISIPHTDVPFLRFGDLVGPYIGFGWERDSHHGAEMKDRQTRQVSLFGRPAFSTFPVDAVLLMRVQNAGDQVSSLQTKPEALWFAPAVGSDGSVFQSPIPGIAQNFAPLHQKDSRVAELKKLKREAVIEHLDKANKRLKDLQKADANK